MTPEAGLKAHSQDEPIRVEVWSDFACPWCYIGGQQFVRGLEIFTSQAGAPAVEVMYRSYQIAPDSPQDFNGSVQDFFEQERGFPAASFAIQDRHVAETAESVGLDYRADRVQANTAKAHELSHFAKAHGKQQELTTRIFEAHFAESSHIGCIDSLVGLARELGLDEEASRSALQSGRYVVDVDADIRQARAIGVTSVPFFLLDDHFKLSGLQEPATFSSALEHIRATRG